MKIMEVYTADDIAPMYLQYPGQHEPQGVYVEIDPEARTIGVQCNEDIGGLTPTTVRCRRVLWIGSISPLINSNAINTLLRVLLPLAERIEAGYDSDWRDGNMVGIYDADATAAIAEVEDIVSNYMTLDQCDRDDVCEVEDMLDAIDVWSYYGCDAPDATDADIVTDIAKDIRQAATRDHIKLLGDVEGHLRDKISEAI